MKFTDGEKVKVFGYDWIVLDAAFEGEDGGDVLCLMDETMAEMPMFGGRPGLYGESDVKAYLEKKTLKFCSRTGLYSYEMKLDLTCDDGTAWGEEYCADGFFLLTKDLYRKYRRHIGGSFGGRPMWLATSATETECSDKKGWFCAVTWDGTVGNYDAHTKLAVRPAFIFREEELSAGVYVQKAADFGVELDPDGESEDGGGDILKYIIKLQSKVLDLEERVKKLESEN